MSSASAKTLALAVTMEQSAIRLYERAAMVLSGEAAACALSLLEDEKTHLRDFQGLLSQATCEGFNPAEGLLLTAKGESILYPGGLAQAGRDGAFSSAAGLLQAAIAAEERSIAFYTQAEEDPELSDKERETFKLIAVQEQEHREIWLKSLKEAESPKNCG